MCPFPRALRRPVVAAFWAATVLAGCAACASAAPGTPGTPAAPAAPVAAGTKSATSLSKSQAGPFAGLTADRIASMAVADLQAASSVHVVGSLVSSGRTFVLDLTLGPQNCSGVIHASGEGSFTMLRVGQTLWIKPDNQFWAYATQGRDPAAVKLFEGKYIQTTAGKSSFSSLGVLCNPRQFADSFGSKMTNMVRGATVTISGQPALQIKDRSGPDSAYVTFAARPEFLRLEGAGHGRLDFTDYNVPLVLGPPPPAETIDGAKYGF